MNILRLVESDKFSARVGKKKKKDQTTKPSVPRSRAYRAAAWVGNKVKGAAQFYSRPLLGGLVDPAVQVVGRAVQGYADAEGSSRGRKVAGAIKNAGDFLGRNRRFAVGARHAYDAYKTGQRINKAQRKGKSTNLFDIYSGALQAKAAYGELANRGATSMSRMTDRVANRFIHPSFNRKVADRAEQAGETVSNLKRGKRSTGGRSYWGEGRAYTLGLIESEVPLVEVTRSDRLMASIMRKRLGDTMKKVQAHLSDTGQKSNLSIKDVQRIARENPEVGRMYRKLRNSTARVRRHTDAEGGKKTANIIDALRASENDHNSSSTVSLPAAISNIAQFRRSASKSPYKSKPNDRVRRAGIKARAALGGVKSKVRGMVDSVKSYFTRSKPAAAPKKKPKNNEDTNWGMVPANK